MIKLLLNVCTGLHSNLFTFVIILPACNLDKLLKLGYLDTASVYSGEVESLSCYWYDPIIMNLLSEQVFLKLCQKDNLCQSTRNIETFVNNDKLNILRRKKVTNILKFMKPS